MKRVTISHTSENSFGILPYLYINDDQILQIKSAVHKDDVEPLNKTIMEVLHSSAYYARLSESDRIIVHTKKRLLDNYPINNVNDSIVIFAAREGSMNVLRWCQEMGVSFNIPNGHKHTALNICMQKVNSGIKDEAAEFLVSIGAGIFVVNGPPKLDVLYLHPRDNHKFLAMFKTVEQCAQYLE